MRSFLIFLCLFTLIARVNSQDSLRLEKIIENFEQFIRESKDSQAHWPDYSVEAIDRRREAYSSFSSSLNDIDKERLNSNQIINYEMLSYIVEDRLFNLEFESHLMPLNSEGGFITSIIYYLQSVRINDEKQLQSMTKKLEAFPVYIEQQKALMRAGIKEGKIHSKLVVNNCLDIINDLLSKSEDSNLFSSAYIRNNIPPDYLLIEKCNNALYSLSSFLNEEYLSAAFSEIGISKIKNGRAFYAQRVKYFTSLEMSPEEVFVTGLAEVERIHLEMLDLLDSLSYEGTLEDFIVFLREDDRFYADTREELLYYAAWLSKRAEAFLPRYFGKLPSLPFTVSPVPDAIAPSYTTGRYSGGSMQSGEPGKYLVNTYMLEARPLYLLPALTLHEAVPGHHLQGSLAREMNDLPSFRRYYLSAFGEGWGLYSEYLGKEAGYYEDLYQEFGRLSYEMWRACRLVIDPGIHVMGWSRDEAVDYLARHTSLSMHEVNTEIDRYIGWPGQAVSYKIGELKIKELRRMAETGLADDFDIKSFHDLLLANGSVPLSTLERIVTEYINQIKGNG
jgi:uncharacterized protein (DUF885 family)